MMVLVLIQIENMQLTVNVDDIYDMLDLFHVEWYQNVYTALLVWLLRCGGAPVR